MEIVNDTSTLNGALAELGSLMAQNLTTQGLIGVSASDGLTTLANDILLIQGGGGSTVIFEDACDSASGLSNYGSVVGLEGSTSGTLSYDSTENAYSLISTGSGIKVFPIIALNGLDSFKLTADMKFPNTSSMGGGLSCIIASTNTGATVICNKSSPQDVTRQFAENGSEKHWSNVASLSSFDYNKYYKVELIVDGYEAKYTFYDGTTQLATYTYTLDTLSNQFTTLANRGYGLGLGWKNATSYPIFVKNIKAESLDTPYSPCAEYIAEIDSAIEYINGDGT